MENNETIKSETNCPTCGAKCTVGGEGETHFYIPIDQTKKINDLHYEALNEMYRYGRFANKEGMFDFYYKKFRKDYPVFCAKENEELIEKVREQREEIKYAARNIVNLKEKNQSNLKRIEELEELIKKSLTK